MTLEQHHEIRLWLVRHRRDHPIEKEAWEGVLTLWLVAWVGWPTALLLSQPIVLAASLPLMFLPALYVAVRRYLHRQHWLRCDWIDVLR
jgi:hypothetical protein